MGLTATTALGTVQRALDNKHRQQLLTTNERTQKSTGRNGELAIADNWLSVTTLQ